MMRWPGLPTLIAGESLSSWLRRIGIVYGLSANELVKWGLGFQGVQTRSLDRSPPVQLVEALSARTGEEVETVHKATFSGTLPFLFDSAGKDDTESESTSRISTLGSGLSKGIPWFRKQKARRVTVCRLCFENYPDAAQLLIWQLAILQSCPVHRLMLEPAQIEAESVTWLNDKAEQAPEVVRLFDSRTWAAVTEGRVHLPGGVVDTGKWFWLLRVTHRNLKRPIMRNGRKEWQEIVCQRCPKILYGRRTQSDPARRWAIVLATALDLMEKGQMELIGRGDFQLSWSMYSDSIYSGVSPEKLKKEADRWNRWSSR
jgi:hypothetical protein